MLYLDFENNSSMHTIYHVERFNGIFISNILEWLLSFCIFFNSCIKVSEYVFTFSAKEY